jgi:hypothetical protein
MTLKKYAISRFNEVTQTIEAERMVVVGESVTLFVGTEVKAFFPKVGSVVVDLAVLADPAGAQVVDGGAADRDVTGGV